MFIVAMETKHSTPLASETRSLGTRSAIRLCSEEFSVMVRSEYGTVILQ